MKYQRFWKPIGVVSNSLFLGELLNLHQITVPFVAIFNTFWEYSALYIINMFADKLFWIWDSTVVFTIIPGPLAIYIASKINKKIMNKKINKCIKFPKCLRSILFLSNLLNVIHKDSFQISFTLILHSIITRGYVVCFSKFFSSVFFSPSSPPPQLLADKQSSHQKTQHRSPHVYTCHKILWWNSPVWILAIS